jgi:hypothetical protein
MGVRVVSKIPEFILKNDVALDTSLGRMAKDIEILAKARAPYKTGQLTKIGESVRITNRHHTVRFDEDYAAYQERGSRIDGTHQVRRYTTPSTGKNFLKDAGKQIAEQATHYFIQAINQISI